MSKSQELQEELVRMLRALKAYREGRWEYPNPRHATTKRATLDLTRKLAEWRKAPSYNYNGKSQEYVEK